MTKSQKILCLIALFIICSFASVVTSCSKQSFTLIFHNDMGEQFSDETIMKDDLSYYKLPEPSMEGYVFKGWFLDESFSELFDVSKITNDRDVIDFYAYWKPIDQRIITINYNLINSVSLSCGNTEQVINAGDDLNPIKITSNIGYKYLYYEINGTRFYDDVITLSDVQFDTDITIVSEYKTYELPIVNINTNGLPILNKIDYVDMLFSIENCDDELLDVEGGIRLRGNSTIDFDKKPYRIKFNKKQSLFGLEKAKSWVLLADYLDPSCLHNYTALSLGNELDGLSFTPTPNKVNVYLNGEYGGLYTLCEQVQENKGRINIEKEITADMQNLKDFNFFICMDESVINDVDAVENETYFYLEEYGKYIELKYPEKADFVTEEQFVSFFNQLKVYVKALFDGFCDNDYDFISNEVNINSLIDFYIIDTIMMETDHYYKSFNMYFTSASTNANENNKLNFGPIWDYDWCLNTPWTGAPNQCYTVDVNTIFYSNAFFQTISEIDELQTLVENRYSEYASQVLGDFIEHLQEYELTIEQSLSLNNERWYSSISDATQRNIEFLNNFLINRKEFLDSVWIK